MPEEKTKEALEAEAKAAQEAAEAKAAEEKAAAEKAASEAQAAEDGMSADDLRAALKKVRDENAKARIKAKELSERAARADELEAEEEKRRLAKLEEVEREKELRIKAEQALADKDAQLARANRLSIVAGAQVVEEYRGIVEARLAAEMEANEDLDVKAFMQDQRIRYPAIFAEASTATAGGPQGRGSTNAIEDIIEKLKTERSEPKRMELALRLKAERRKAAAK